MEQNLSEDPERRTNPIPLWAKIIGVPLAILLGFFSHALGGWGLPGALAAAAIFIPLVKYQRYWHKVWFWSTMTGMAILQIPLVIVARPLMDQVKFLFNIAFATIDVFLVAIAVNFVRPKGDL